MVTKFRALYCSKKIYINNKKKKRIETVFYVTFYTV
jgi:hypothetical protein